MGRSSSLSTPTSDPSLQRHQALVVCQPGVALLDSSHRSCFATRASPPARFPALQPVRALVVPQRAPPSILFTRPTPHQKLPNLVPPAPSTTIHRIGRGSVVSSSPCLSLSQSGGTCNKRVLVSNLQQSILKDIDITTDPVSKRLHALHASLGVTCRTPPPSPKFQEKLLKSLLIEVTCETDTSNCDICIHTLWYIGKLQRFDQMGNPMLHQAFDVFKLAEFFCQVRNSAITYDDDPWIHGVFLVAPDGEKKKARAGNQSKHQRPLLLMCQSTCSGAADNA